MKLHELQYLDLKITVANYKTVKMFPYTCAIRLKQWMNCESSGCPALGKVVLVYAVTGDATNCYLLIVILQERDPEVNNSTTYMAPVLHF